jgi:hypothetical protein
MYKCPKCNNEINIGTENKRLSEATKESSDVYMIFGVAKWEGVTIEIPQGYDWDKIKKNVEECTKICSSVDDVLKNEQYLANEYNKIIQQLKKGE